jgi:hypothetical protein
VLDDRAPAQLDDLIHPALVNYAGTTVGEICVDPEWANAAP